mmetsp:Transcript_47814/g.116408  ORF Transcript_47814/g.116408 Transcript_47814/m.116408 type:complete len:203 (-) Transcript_47814:1397-2005(-)
MLPARATCILGGVRSTEALSLGVGAPGPYFIRILSLSGTESCDSCEFLRAIAGLCACRGAAPLLGLPGSPSYEKSAKTLSACTCAMFQTALVSILISSEVNCDEMLEQSAGPPTFGFIGGLICLASSLAQSIEASHAKFHFLLIRCTSPCCQVPGGSVPPNRSLASVLRRPLSTFLASSDKCAGYSISSVSSRLYALLVFSE